MPTNLVHLILLVFAFCCFVVGAWQSVSPMWNRIVAVGFAALAASMFV